MAKTIIHKRFSQYWLCPTEVLTMCGSVKREHHTRREWADVTCKYCLNCKTDTGAGSPVASQSYTMRVTSTEE